MKSFPSKILLLGEYGILKGSMGLAIPYPVYSGRLVLPSDDPDFLIDENARRSNRHLRFLLEYLETQSELFAGLKISELRNDIEHGLYFDSNIPEGYGLGSSGALTAALYYRYANVELNRLSFIDVRKNFATIEKFFHGTSSGLDPLVSWINKPVVIDNDGSVRILDQSDPNNNLASSFFSIQEKENSKVDVFLLDTNSPGKTGNLVNWFLEEYNNFEFRRAVQEVYLPSIQQAVDFFLLNKSLQFLDSIASISAFQMQYLSQLIPRQIIDHLDYGLSTDNFYLKLCGSGGGGFMLGFSRDKQETRNYFLKNGFDIRFL